MKSPPFFRSNGTSSVRVVTANLQSCVVTGSWNEHPISTIWGSPVVSWLTRQVTGGFTIKTGGLMGLHEGLYVICVDFPFSSLVLSFPYQVLIHMNLRPTKRETNKAVI